MNINKVYSLILAFLFILNLPSKAQDTGEDLLDKTASKLEKDGGITMKLDVIIRDGLDSDRREITFDMYGKSFHSTDEENTLWFDGKTLWRGSDFGSGIEEIYISEPLPDEMERFDIIKMLREHEGFDVTGNGRDTFILTSDSSGSGIAGIRRVTVKVDPLSYRLLSVNVLFAEDLGGIIAEITVLEYTPGQKFEKSTFVCPVKDYRDADIIDLR